jgi:eukaryotic-like serine/threonine-protein kinase
MSGDLQRIVSLDTILRPGKIVGEKYRVDKLIAEGGMAAVWAGVNERTGKRVALKAILGSFAAVGDTAELFRREALAASKVNHPNVVNIFDVIDHEGMTCIVMELLDGETFDKYLARNGTLSLQETMTLLLPAMRGVAAANAQGVVHRDLKPGNIFLCSDADGRLLTTKVLDFGIATMMERAGEKSTGAVVMAQFGTPAYMAPEAIQCFPGIDGRTDVYGFGVIIFQALTGQLPFPGEAGTELLARIVTEPPLKVTAYRPDLPAEAVHIIDCALAKDAKDRFPDMEHLIRAIEDHLLPPSPLQRALTPMTGISQRLWVESDSGPAVTAVHTSDGREPSGRVHPSETRVLFALPGSPAHARDAAVGPSTLPATIPAKQAWWKQPLLPGMRRLSHRSSVLGATLGVVLVATAWLALSKASGGRGVGKVPSASASQPRVPARGADFVPPPIMPSRPSQAPTPGPEVGGLAESLVASEATQPDRQPNQARTAAATPRPPLGASRPAIRAAAPLPSTRVVRAQPARGGIHKGNSPNRPAAPRAGRLSPSDF